MSIRPQPPLVGVELNPGPGRKLQRGEHSQLSKGERLAEKQRWRVVFLHEEAKLSQRDIADRVGITKKSVGAILKKEQETGTVHDRKGRGRKRKTTATDDKLIIREAKKGKSSPAITQELKKRTGKKVSNTTVQRRLKQHNYCYLKIQKLSRLTPEQKEKRMRYSQSKINANWKNVLFLDEKSFWLESFPSHAWQQRKENTERNFTLDKEASCVRWDWILF